MNNQGLGYQSSAAPSDAEIERDELRERLDLIEQHAQYTFSIERARYRVVDGEQTISQWSPWVWGLSGMEHARDKKAQLEADVRFPGAEWRIVRTMKVTLYETMV